MKNKKQSFKETPYDKEIINAPIKKTVEHKVPPVKIGDIIIIKPNGMAEKDAYVDYEGYIIFIKKLPMDKLESHIKLKITAVKSTFGFAEYNGDAQ